MTKEFEVKPYDPLDPRQVAPLVPTPDEGTKFVHDGIYPDPPIALEEKDLWLLEDPIPEVRKKPKTVLEIFDSLTSGGEEK